MTVPILGSIPEPEPEEMDFFKALAMQDENFYEAVAPFFGEDSEKEEVLNDIASLCLQFTIARVFRYQQLRGVPRSVRFRIEVDVEGDERKTESGLHVGQVDLPEEIG